ncbi:MAG: TonB-dependent receptor [Bacteroidales bacterium]|nr:TonB-dependent receptor [Bacteroidales bacterium]
MKHYFFNTWRKRTRIAIVIISILSFFSNNLFSQDTLLNRNIELDKDSYSLGEVFNEISTKYDINFSYNDSEVSQDHTLRLPEKNLTIKQLLDRIKKEYQLEYKIYSNTIILIKKKPARPFTISGYIEDKNTGEKLLGASVYLRENYSGTFSNNYGFYSLTLNEVPVHVVVSYLGYQTQVMSISNGNDTLINFNLTGSSTEIEEVVIEGYSKESDTRSNLSAMRITSKEIEKIPAILGETDVLKSLQLLPGVQSGMEGFSGLVVRGGGTDQNLIVLDGVPVYNVNHLFGFFSVFNPAAIKDVSLHKSGFPARYGGRASSVIDINMKEGNNKELHGEGSIGLISSRFTIEGPIKNENTSFIISGRRTYFDVVGKPFLTKKEGDQTNTYGYYFYDLNMKINHRYSDKSRLFLSSYLGNDVLKLDSEVKQDQSFAKQLYNLKWGNVTTNLRWNYTLNNKLFTNTTLSYSNYRFLLNYKFDTKNYVDLEEEITHDSQEFLNGIYDVSAKVDFDYFPNQNHIIKFGTGYCYHTFVPSSYTQKKDPGRDTSYRQNIYGHEAFLYLEDNMRIGNNVNVNMGFHYSFFNVKKENYFHIQPRISSKYSPWSNVTCKASISKMVQYLQTNSYSSISLPIDLWVPSTDSLLPVESWNYSLGVDYQYNKRYSIGIEGFYKTMNNVITFQEGAFPTTDFMKDIVQGKGWAYGVEFMIKKNTGNTSGWLSYTWSNSWRQFEGISMDKKFPYKYDRRHDIGFVLLHKFNDRVDMSSTWVFGTGIAMSLSTEKYVSNFTLEASSDNDIAKPYIQKYETRNNYRMPHYHRMDIGVNFHKEKKKYTRTWSFGAYNVYNRQNALWIHWENVDQYSDEIGLYQISIFQITPYFSYSIKF